MNANFVKQAVVAFIVGGVFAIGLALTGMTQPQKIIGFLDPWNWDPTLLYVMLGAISIHLLSYPFVRRRASPLLDTKWHVPTRNDVTARLAIGAAIFGIGWGLAGFCPGPGLVSLASGDVRAILFVCSMIAGILVFRKVEPYLKMRV